MYNNLQPQKQQSILSLHISLSKSSFWQCPQIGTANPANTKHRRNAVLMSDHIGLKSVVCW